jgi:DNA-binding CsgD family transcriptional regulator
MEQSEYDRAPGLNCFSVAWPDLDPRIRELAEEVLTERQLAAFKLASDGAGYTTVAVSLDISRSYARDLVRESQRRLERAMRQPAT